MNVSIAMATYNGAKYIREQLDSIIGQTARDWELVVSDDGSSDSTVEIVEEYARKDQRIRLVKNAGRRGFAENFANALRHCTGEYAAFCDQDDVWTKDHIAHLAEQISNERGGGVFANAELVGSSLEPLGLSFWEKMDITEQKLCDNLFLSLIFGNYMQGAASLFRRDLPGLLPFPEGFYHDHWVAILSALNGGLSFSDKIILKYRQHEGSVIGAGVRVSLTEKIKSLNSNGAQRLSRYRTILEYVQKNSDRLSDDVREYAEGCLEIARRILFEKRLSDFRKYYHLIFRDSSRRKFLRRYLQTCVFFPFFRGRMK